jgi:hypothetical protein
VRVAVCFGFALAGAPCGGDRRRLSLPPKAEVHREYRCSLDRLHQTPCRCVLSKMLQHLAGGPEGGDRIGNPLAGDIEGRSMDRLEHRRETPLRVDIGRWRDTKAARQRAGKVREDIGMKIRRNDGIKA